MESLIYPLKFFLEKKPLSKLRQYVKDTKVQVPVFAFDVNKNGSKLFLIGGAFNFASYYLHMNNERSFYEVLEYDRPLKLYFDIEFQLPSACNMNICVEKINSALQSLLNRPLSYLELDSSTATKASRHLVYNCLVSNMRQMKLLVNAVIKDLTESNVGSPYLTEIKDFGIDSAVYTKARCFRILGSSKYGRHVPLKLIKNGVIQESLCREHLLQSLISVYRFHDTPIDYNDITELYFDSVTVNEIATFRHSEIISFGIARAKKHSWVFHSPVVARKKQRVMKLEDNANVESEVIPKDTVAMVNRIKETYIKSRFPEAYIHPIYDSLNKNTLSFSLKGIKCKCSNRIHKNNRMFLNLDIQYIGVHFVPAYFVCTDVDCKGNNIWRTDSYNLYSYLVNQSTL